MAPANGGRQTWLARSRRRRAEVLAPLCLDLAAGARCGGLRAACTTGEDGIEPLGAIERSPWLVEYREREREQIAAGGNAASEMVEPAVYLASTRAATTSWFSERALTAQVPGLALGQQVAVQMVNTPCQGSELGTRIEKQTAYTCQLLGS